MKLKQTNVMIKVDHGWQTHYDSCSPAWFSVLPGRQQLSPGSLLPLLTAVVSQVVPGERCGLLGWPAQKALLDRGLSLRTMMLELWDTAFSFAWHVWGTLAWKARVEGCLCTLLIATNHNFYKCKSVWTMHRLSFYSVWRSCHSWESEYITFINIHTYIQDKDLHFHSFF